MEKLKRLDRIIIPAIIALIVMLAAGGGIKAEAFTDEYCPHNVKYTLTETELKITWDKATGNDKFTAAAYQVQIFDSDNKEVKKP